MHRAHTLAVSEASVCRMELCNIYQDSLGSSLFALSVE